MLLVNTVFVYLLVYVFDIMNLPATISVGPFVYWIVFYYMGVYYSSRTRNYSLKIPILLIVIGFVLQILETKYLMLSGYQGVGIKVSSWVYSAGVILLLFSQKLEDFITKDNTVYRQVVKLGTISFGLYLTHMYYVLFESVFVHREEWFMKYIIVATLTIFFVSILRKVIPSRFWRIIGIN